jgi:DNA-binding GntR family transcriptional regulator
MQNAIEPVEKEALQETAYREIKLSIVEGTFPPGHKLSEPELAIHLKVSRSPVREALVRLEQDGFVLRQQNGRVVVAPLDLNELEQLYIVRANLEGLATRLAASHLRTIDLDEMTARLTIMRRHVAAHDFPAAIESGQDFHEVILRACPNAPLAEVLEHLRGRITRFRSVVAGFKDYDLERIEEHQKILDALYARQPAEAEAQMVQHITRSAATLIAKLRNRADKADNS